MAGVKVFASARAAVLATEPSGQAVFPGAIQRSMFISWTSLKIRDLCTKIMIVITIEAVSTQSVRISKAMHAEKRVWLSYLGINIRSVSIGV